jgi:hypothetical protein
VKRRSNFARFGEYLNTHYPVKAKNEQGDGDKQSQAQAILSRFTQDAEQSQIHSDVFDTFMGVKPLRQPPPDDMPALEKIKLYARAGYHMHHTGTDEDFERVWEEALRKENKFGFLVDWRKEKDG